MSTAASLIAEVRKRLEKTYKDSTELFPDLITARKIATIPSGSTIIDAVSGIGGYPRGRVTEIHGDFSTGKTTLAIEAAVACQRADPAAVVLFADWEHAIAIPYAVALGLDIKPERFIYMEPDYFEQGADGITAFLQAGLVDLIILDSAAAMTPKSELEGEMDTEGGTQKGVQSALMARFLSGATKALSKGRKPAMLIINQTRAYINIGGRPQKNAPKTQAAGGNALKFYTSMRLELEIVGKEGDANRGTKGTDQVYTQNKVRVTAVKNKLAPPYVRGEIIIEYGKGINNLASIAELAEAKLGVMSGSGYFKYDGDKPATSFSCRGREAFQEHLQKNPDTLKEIEAKVLAAIKQEHAKALGIGAIKVAGDAKNIEASHGTLILDDEEPDQSPGPGLEGLGLPLSDD